MKAVSIGVFVLGAGVSLLCAACGDAPQAEEDVASIRGCAFVNRLLDISDNGERFDTPRPLLSQGRDVGVQVSHSKAAWLLGSDTDGVAVIIDRDTGEVRSHGVMHTGREQSALPFVLDTPVSLGE
jgi:hypothetical protein